MYRLLRAFAAFFIVMLFSYLIGCFCEAKFDITTWGTLNRGVIGAFGGLFGGIAALITFVEIKD